MFQKKDLRGFKVCVMLNTIIKDMAAKSATKKQVSKSHKAAAKVSRKPQRNAVAAQKEPKVTMALEENENQPKAVPVAMIESDFEIRRTKIKIIGLGGGGSNIVAGIASKVKKASFCVVNTDYQALAHIGGVTTFQFGQKFTKGLGTGMDPAIAEEAARDEREKIKKLLEGNDLVILVASLGGGTGSGAAPVFAQISKSLGNLTYGIFSMPFAFEGAKKEEIARVALEKARPYLSALTILPNERVFQVVPKTTPFTKTMSFINDNLSKNLEGLIEMIYEPGMINIDFADVRTILSGQGKLAFLNTVEFQKGEGVEIESFENAFLSPLYPYAIDKARGLLINIGGQKDLKLSEVNKILTGVSARIHKEAKIILGISQSGQAFDGVKVTVLATGCAPGYGQENGSLAGEPKKEKKTVEKKAVEPKKAAPKKPVAKKPSKKLNIKVKRRPVAAAARNKKNIVAPNPEPVIKPDEPAREADDTIKMEDVATAEPGEVNLRKNAIEVKKEIEREEKEMLEKEKAWEIPAFLRKRPKKS